MRPQELSSSVDEDLLKRAPGSLLDAYLAARTADRFIKIRGGERRPWLRAEDHLIADLRALADVASGTRRAKTGKKAAGATPEQLLAAFAAALREGFDSVSPDAAAPVLRGLRLVPVEGDAPRWSRVHDLLAALDESLSYSDGDGDETWLPREAEPFMDLCELVRDEKTAAPAQSWAERKKRRGKVKVRRFSMRETFSAGEWIAHAKFGEGLVLEAVEKIRVLFEDGERSLAHTPAPRAPVELPRMKPPAPARPAAVIPEGVRVKRLAPDPRLTEDPDQVQFEHLAKETDEDSE
jgi:hypothetical protein